MKNKQNQQQSKLMVKTRIIYIIMLIVLLIAVDQVIKYMILNKNIDVSSFTNVNIETIDYKVIGLNIFTGLVVIALAINFLYHQIEIIDKVTIVGVSMIVAGISSNIIDKLFKGVTIYIFKLFGIFDLNLASCFMIIGWIIVIFTTMIFSNIKDLNKKRIIEEQDKEFKTGKNSKIKG